MKRFNNQRLKTYWVYVLFFTVMLLSELQAGFLRAEDTSLKIGVLAIRGHQQCLNRWSPTADFLSRRITGRRFDIVPLSHDQIYSQVQRGEVDFILANSAYYVGLEYWYQANRIVTLKEKRAAGISTQYGGVIFCRSDRKDIRTLRDLKNKSFMAVSESSLGGWLMAWRELHENGIDPYRDFKELRFDETHDSVVYAVRDGIVDAGTVRTSTLEDLHSEGKIDLADYYVFPQLHAAEGVKPYFCTTREYPNWPLAKVRHTPDDLAERVAVALLQMPPDSPAAIAAGCAGWTIPLNYQPVHDCLKILKVGPYKDLGKITPSDVLRSYGHWIFFAFAAFIILVTFFVVVLKLNSEIRTSNEHLKVEMGLRRQKDQELKQAKELAEAATRTKSEFLANMSHEIRTPMNGVIAAADLALSENVPPKIEHYLKIIQNSAYSLLGIINDILDFSKIEAGKFELKERTFRLNDVLDRVMDLFINKAAEKGIELLVDIDTDTPKALIGDPLRLQQILTNLISNAVKFTDSGMVLLSARPQSEPVVDSTTDEMILAFAIKDTGSGIAPAYIDQLFAPFSQADSSSTRKYEGTGLGLSICKQLVTMMGGDIGVESELGIGSTFFFTVRLRRPSDQPGSRWEVPPDIQGLNVLVVDDLADSRIIMRKMLESMGFRVETLVSGPEALKRLKDNLLRSDPVELIMMDWKMPEIDGIEVSKKIRQELKLTMPIIMMTAFGKEEHRVEAEKAGINGFLTKPIYPSTLFDAIMDGFGKEGARNGGRKRPFTTRASMYRKPLKGARILVAEDNPTNQQVAQAILEGAGIIVTIVNNGEAAVNALQHDPFDAVLMDIQMPKMNGYEATRQIRELPEGRSIPIVAMTAHAMKGDEEKCLEAGMDGYISKPVNQDYLFHTLWRLLRHRKYSSDWAAPAEPEEERGVTGNDHEDRGSGETSRSSIKTIETDSVFPPKLPGLNFEEALAALNIDRDTLTRILRGFLSDNRDTLRNINQASTGTDMEAMRHLAHTLKGSAANIGASELSRTARALEEACDHNIEPSALKRLISDLEATLKQVFESIQSLERPFPGNATAIGSDDTYNDADALLTQLAEAIERADPVQIMKIIPIIRQQAAQSENIDPFSLETLTDQVNRYDYDQALETVNKMKVKSQGTP
jgi:signal transduction histidine kinase/CheY-like chemotaxis protein